MTIETPKSGRSSQRRPERDAGESLLEEGSRDAKRPRKPARERVMDLLAGRNHSEFELTEKMSADYSRDEIEDAIGFARERKWLLSAEELAQEIATALARKGKGQRFIEQVLESKGLPSVASRDEDEVAKGRALVLSKLAGKLPKDAPFDYEIETKIYRLLANRGFEEDTIHAVVESIKKQPFKGS